MLEKFILFAKMLLPKMVCSVYPNQKKNENFQKNIGVSKLVYTIVSSFY